MDKIGLIGGGFQHAFSSTLWKKPTKFSWSKNKIEDITFFVDESIEYGLNVKCERKFAWLLESRKISPRSVQFVKQNWQRISSEYEILFTHNKEIYELTDNFVYLPPHGFWIESPKIYPKSKLVSMISSNKNYPHRLNWVNKLKDSLDLYGMGFKGFEKKESALNDYMFSVTIENDIYETYWSEKILDCFATGTIPIYLGSPDIGDFFNMEGIILLTDDFDINSLSIDEYNSRIPAIKDNLNRVLNYDIIEDIIYNKWIRLQ
jgi:hypothetical protein